MRGGFLGVEVFFVVSGFLITGLLAQESARTGRIDLGRFWKRRMLRLYPALLAFVLVVSSLGLLFLPGQAAQFRGDLLASFTYLENWYQVHGGSSYFADQGYPLCRHLWSLAVEGQFYLVWPFLVAALLGLGKGRKGPLVALTVVLAGASFALMALRVDPGNLSAVKAEASLNRAYLGTDTRAFGLLVGALLALLLRRVSTGRRLALGVNLLALAGLAGLMVAMVVVDAQAEWLYRGGFLLVDGLTVLVLLGLCLPASTWMPRILGWAPLEWLGLRSYGLYLWHWPVFRLLAGAETGWPWFLLRLAVTLVVTELSYRYLEVPVRQGALAGLWNRPRWASVVRLAAAGLVAVAVLETVALTRLAPYVDPVQEAIRAGAAATDSPVPASVPVPVPAPAEQASANSGHGSGVTTPVVPVTLPEALQGIHVTTIGDSVMKGAAPALKKMGEATLGPGMIQINAEESRPFLSATPILQAYKNEKRLGEVVVVHLGTNNSAISTEQFRKLMGVLVDTHLVLFLTAKSDKTEACATVNRTLGQLAATYPNARILDWNAAASGHPEYFYADKTHLRPEGAAHYAELILTRVAQPLAELGVGPLAAARLDTGGAKPGPVGPGTPGKSIPAGAASVTAE